MGLPHLEAPQVRVEVKHVESNADTRVLHFYKPIDGCASVVWQRKTAASKLAVVPTVAACRNEVETVG